MDYYGGKIASLATQVSTESSELDRFLVDCRSSGGGWNDGVSESYLRYTALLTEKANNIIYTADRTRTVESKIDENKVDSFDGKVQNLARELSSI